MAITRLGPNQDITAAKIAGTINFKNLIINGDMSIAQRGTSFTSDQYVLDRFTTSNNNHSGAWSWTQVTDAPSGFKYSAKFTTTTADSSTATNQYSLFRHYIEGSNISNLKFGTSDAETITVSFYVKSSLTGTFGGSISNDDQNRSYPFTYTISSASTWERKTITLSGDTTGTWKTDTSTGIRINFSMGTGTSYQGTSGAWNGNTDFSATGETSVLATLNATWQITGVQLEADTSASDFEFLPYDVNLRRCQRYYALLTGRLYLMENRDGGNKGIVFPYPQTMRTTPTISYTLSEGSLYQNNSTQYMLSLSFGSQSTGGHSDLQNTTVEAEL